jgi:CHASE3 domain sensor protein
MAKRSAGSYALLQSILLGVGFALLVLISVATVFLVDRAGADAKRLTNTLTLHGSLSNLLLEVRRAESSQRGYLFTNDESYLTDCYETEPAIRQVF